MKCQVVVIECFLLPELEADESDGVEEEEGDGRHQVEEGHVPVLHPVHRTHPANTNEHIR